MAKKAPAEQTRFNPVEKHLISSVIGRPSPKMEEAEKVIEIESKKEMPDKPQNNIEAKEEALEREEVKKQPPKQKPKRQVQEAPKKEKQKETVEIEHLEVAKRLLLTKKEALELDSFSPLLAAKVGTPIKFSHIVRSALRLIIENQAEILEEAEGASITRPANGDRRAIQEFEMELAKVVLSGIRKGRG